MFLQVLVNCSDAILLFLLIFREFLMLEFTIFW